MFVPDGDQPAQNLENRQAALHAEIGVVLVAPAFGQELQPVCGPLCVYLAQELDQLGGDLLQRNLRSSQPSRGKFLHHAEQHQQRTAEVHLVAILGRPCSLYYGGYGLGPLVWVVYADDLSDHESIVQRKRAILFVHGTLQQSGADEMTLGGLDGVPDVVPPISIDAILEEDNSEKSDVARQVLGQESSLEREVHAPPRLVLVSVQEDREAGPVVDCIPVETGSSLDETPMTGAVVPLTVSGNGRGRWQPGELCPARGGSAGSPLQAPRSRSSW